MKRFICGIIAATLLLALSTSALAGRMGAPELAGSIEASELAWYIETSEPAGRIDVAELQATIEQFVQQNSDTTAAMSLSVFTSQDVLLEQSHGYINIAESIPNTPEAVFEWGSVTKLLLVVSVMQLVEQGLIDLNASIHTYLPDGFLTKLAYDDPITMTHLLSHTAGFQEAVVELFVQNDSRIRPLEEALRRLQPPQVYRPGEVTAYSNFSSGLAGFIVQRVSGQPFYAYVHEHVFAPIGMTQTALLPDLSDNAWVKAQRGRTQCYTTDLRSLGTLDLAIPWYPAGMATGTISDLRKFGQALLPDAGGASPLFSRPQTLGMLYTPTSYYPNGVTGLNFHGFWAELHLAGTVIGHGGNTAGMSAMLHIDIENSLGAVIMTNQAGEQVYNRQMSTLIFGASDFSRIDNSANDVRVSGAFRSVRNFQQGWLRMYALFGNTMPLFQQSDDVISIPIFGELHRVAPGVYLSSEDSMMGNIVFFIAANEAGEAESVTMLVGDYVRVSWGLVIFEIIITLLLALSGFYGLAVLIRLLVTKIRKKEQAFTLLRAGAAAALLLVIANSLVMAMSALSVALTLPGATIHGILQILLTMAFVACTALLLLKLRTPGLLKKQKRQIVTPAIMCAVMMVNTIYWQFWVFWV